jgi:type II protein arginine methyltransferase
MQVLRAHFDYLTFLFQKLPPLTGLGATGFAFRDKLQLPLQPLADNLDNSVYKIFEQDRPKYDQYKEALKQALHDIGHQKPPEIDEKRAGSGFFQAKAPEEMLRSSSGSVLIAVLGAGRGALVDAALKAADSVDVNVQVCCRPHLMR